MVLPYETMLDSIAAQNDIKEFLEFLGAGNVLCTVSEKMDCVIQWSLYDEVTDFGVNAEDFIRLWMNSEPWKRRPVVSESLGDHKERELAVNCFWYFVRDLVFHEVPKMIFDKVRLVKLSEQATHLLVKRMTLSSSS